MRIKKSIKKSKSLMNLILKA